MMSRFSDAHPLVVVVDDDPSVRRSLGRFLCTAGFEVKTMASAGELLAYDWPARPTCLVVDIHLPDMNGLALLRRIAAANSRLPVVVISGEVNPELGTEALRQGAMAFLAKPIDTDRLLNEVQSALDP